MQSKVILIVLSAVFLCGVSSCDRVCDDIKDNMPKGFAYRYTLVKGEGDKYHCATSCFDMSKFKVTDKRFCAKLVENCDDILGFTFETQVGKIDPSVAGLHKLYEGHCGVE